LVIGTSPEGGIMPHAALARGVSSCQLSVQSFSCQLSLVVSSSSSFFGFFRRSFGCESALDVPDNRREDRAQLARFICCHASLKGNFRSAQIS
jgi:hypothetical protein